MNKLGELVEEIASWNIWGIEFVCETADEWEVEIRFTDGAFGIYRVKKYTLEIVE